MTKTEVSGKKTKATHGKMGGATKEGKHGDAKSGRGFLSTGKNIFCHVESDRYDCSEMTIVGVASFLLVRRTISS